jgi:hypothetical protein
MTATGHESGDTMANGRYVSHGEFSQFREDVRGQFAAMHNDQQTKHKETIAAIDKIREKAEPTGTNWSVLLAAFGVIVMFLAIYVRPIEVKTNEHAALDGHPEQLKWQAASEERFSTAFAAILRNAEDSTQMRADLDKVRVDRFTGSDGRAITEKVYGVDVRLARLEAQAGEWQDAHDERHDIEERVRALEGSQ